MAKIQSKVHRGADRDQSENNITDKAISLNHGDKELVINDAGTFLHFPSEEKLAADGLTVSDLSVSGDLSVNGNITANAFIGDGSGLTSLPDLSDTYLPLTGGTIAGVLGIGTSSPINNFEVSSSTSIHPVFRCTTNAINNYSGLIFATSTGEISSNNLLGEIRTIIVDDDTLKAKMSFFINTGDLATEQMTLDETGKLGIGNGLQIDSNVSDNYAIVEDGSLTLHEPNEVPMFANSLKLTPDGVDGSLNISDSLGVGVYLNVSNMATFNGAVSTSGNKERLHINSKDVSFESDDAILETDMTERLRLSTTTGGITLTLPVDTVDKTTTCYNSGSNTFTIDTGVTTISIAAGTAKRFERCESDWYIL